MCTSFLLYNTPAVTLKNCLLFSIPTNLQLKATLQYILEKHLAYTVCRSVCELIFRTFFLSKLSYGLLKCNLIYIYKIKCSGTVYVSVPKGIVALDLKVCFLVSFDRSHIVTPCGA
jgi:hypothetical protein